MEKYNRYASAEAREAVRLLATGGGLDWAGLLAREPTRRRRALKALSIRLPFRPLLRFLYMYVLRRGFLDGRAGLTYCRLLAIYEYLIVLKTREFDVRMAAEHLENIRLVLHPPVADLAALFEVSRQAIYKWLAGTSTPEEGKFERVRTLSQIADRLHAAGIARAGTLMKMKAFNGRSLMDLIRSGENRDEHLDRLITEARAMERAYGRTGLATTRSRPTRDWQSDISIPGSAERM